MTSSALARRLDAHCEALGACRRCGHDDPGVVPILSPARSPKVMLVGQAPGRVETSEGERKAFAGRAGKTMFRWLATIGVDEATLRSRVYIAAVTRCYPGASPTGRGDRVPSRAEQEECGAWLTAELEIIRPALLVPVGKLAIERFLPSSPLDQLIGRAHEVEHAGGRSLAIPLPHPSGASSWVHAPAHRALLERALALLGAELRVLWGAKVIGRSV
ncbi:MAG TPA: uracil-DNA glycosylase family protein [Gemmatimonadaceae bacterium]|nr:uracil-DNA glycosylase family protein [Gemmatimonadaceae bacterium]